MGKKDFVFLYPIRQIIDFEIKRHSHFKKGGIGAYRRRYSRILNKCIDQRYRRRGFGINYVIFDDCLLSEIIDLRPADKIIYTGIDFEKHRAEKIYSDPRHILGQLDKPKIVTISGFHMWDCVDKLARCAYETGLDVLVDEDLTEFFSGRIEDYDFRTDKYPTYNARNKQGPMFDIFMQVRKQRPWLWQNY